MNLEQIVVKYDYCFQQPGNISIEPLSIQSTATSKREKNSYCIEISAKLPSDYFLHCRTKSSIQHQTKWDPQKKRTEILLREKVELDLLFAGSRQNLSTCVT